MTSYRRYFKIGGRSPGDRRRELSEEVESHIALRAEDLMRRGVPAERAWREAEARFGNREAVFESARERDAMLTRREGLGAVRRDVGLALRQARRAPGATTLTVLTFALGIGLTTAIFSIVYAVLLRPLPYAAPDRLVLVQGMDSTGNAITRVSYANWADLAEQNSTLAATALHEGTRLAVASDAGAYRVPAQIVTTSFFDVLGTRMLFGRGFSPEESVPGPGAVVIGESLWRRELGGRAEAGMTLHIENAPYTVVGVVPDALAYPAGTQLWLPKPPQRRVGGFFRNYIGAEAIARLGPGVSIERAEADLSAIARRVQAADPESDYTYGAPLKPLHAHVAGDVATYLTMLMAAVATVLLLACANLAAMNLARASRRRSEVAVRFALGGSRFAVMRQLLVEQLVLALIGGALGLLLAWAGLLLLPHLAGGQLPRMQEIGLHGGVLLFALAAALLAGVLAGIGPAWKASATSARLLVGTRGYARSGRGVPGAALVGAEIALAVLLLIGAGLLVRSFQAVLARDPGFGAGGVAVADVTLTGATYRDRTQRMQTWAEIVARTAADPSIAAAAVANWIPTGRGGTSYLVVEGHDEDPGGAGYDVVSEGYFDALRIPILRGRGFAARDLDDGVRVALVSRTLADRYWPDGDAVGRRIMTPGMEGPRESAPWLTVIGVVGDVRHRGYEDDRTRNQVYVLYRQVPDWEVAMTVIARHAGGDAGAAGSVLRREIRALDPALAVEPEAIEQRLGTLVGERRLVTSLLGMFGVLALLLAMIGVYALLSFAVAQRTHEIGIRAALGADAGGIVRLVVGSAARLVAAGAFVGLLLAAWATRLLESMLVDVTRLDPVAYAAAVLILCVVALTAAAVPARRASRVDPLTALRALD